MPSNTMTSVWGAVMASDASYVLTRFAPLEFCDPVPQEKVYEMYSWGLAKSHCVRNAITDDQQANEVFEQTKERVRRYCVSPKYIKQRRGVMSVASTEACPKYLKRDGGYAKFHSNDVLFESLRENDAEPDGLTLKERMELYDRTVSECFGKLYENETEAPDDLIHVTCSGYVSPSPAERLVSTKSWSTTVTHCYHMGCYAFFPGLRMATGIQTAAQCGFTTPKKRVDIAHTELLSLHMKLSALTPEDIITQTLFSDGFIRYSLVPESEARKGQGRALRLLTFRESLIPDSLDDMTWVIGNHQFEMTLAIEVPLQIEQNIRPFLDGMFAQVGKSFGAEKESLYFAIHPGGPKIVDFVCSKLNLRSDQVRHSHEILYENGNMSSATIPYLLNAVLNDPSIPDGTLVPAFAFGPGLTIAGALFEKINLEAKV